MITRKAKISVSQFIRSIPDAFLNVVGLIKEFGGETMPKTEEAGRSSLRRAKQSRASRTQSEKGE